MEARQIVNGGRFHDSAAPAARRDAPVCRGFSPFLRVPSAFPDGTRLALAIGDQDDTDIWV